LHSRFVDVRTEEHEVVQAGRWVHRIAAWLLVAGLFVQLFLAGLGVFESTRRFETHALFGYTLEVLPLVLLVAGLVGRLGRRTNGLAVLAFVLFLLQSVFVGLRTDLPMIAALHPVNGVVILLIAIVIARETSRSSPLPQAAGA